MIKIETLNWNKVNGLMPVIIQDESSLQVLMLGYMNQEALKRSYETGEVTFFSRTKNRLWTKGETSGNALILISVHADCDQDSLLIRVKPKGYTCHLNQQSCFGEGELGILAQLEATIRQRALDRPANSYVTTLFEAGIRRIAQKVGEEGVEVALAAVVGEKEAVLAESADLIFHLLVLLKECGIELKEVFHELERRK